MAALHSHKTGGSGASTHPAIPELLARLPNCHQILEARGVAGRGDLYKCPFHDDRSPSLSVYENGDRWYCFAGCGGGDRGDLEARLRNISLAELFREFRRGTAWTARPPTARAAKPKKPKPPARASTVVAAAWKRALDHARVAPADHPARAFLVRAFGVDGKAIAAQLLKEELVGIVPPDESVKWIGERAREGWSLVVPRWLLPPAGEVIETEGEVKPADLVLRWTGAADPPAGKKILRLPRGVTGLDGAVTFYGWPPAAIAAADADELTIVEGWGDYATFAAAGEPVIGLGSAGDGAKAGAILKAELEAVRREGVGGPLSVVFAEQGEEESKAALGFVLAALADLDGLRLKWWKPLRRAAA